MFHGPSYGLEKHYLKISVFQPSYVRYPALSGESLCIAFSARLLETHLGLYNN